MGWERTTDGDDRLAWERDDDRARVTVRRTGDGAWAVTVDLLEQAADGPAYRRETVGSRADALAQATQWRDEYDTS